MEHEVYTYIQYQKDGCPEHLVIPEGYTEVEKDMLNSYFSDGVYSERPVGNLKSLVIPASMEHIQAGAFAGCSNLKSITFADPDSRLRIGNGAFLCSNSLRNVEVPLQAKLGKDAISSRAIKPLKEFTKDDYEKLADKTDVVIPEGFEKIADGVFAETAISTIKMPSTMKVIGEEAFKHCYYLQNIEIPDSVMTIGQSAFMSCQNLVQVILPKNLEVIPERCFFKCTGLKDINLPERLTTLDVEAFMLSGLTSISLPDSMERLAKRSLSCCQNLKVIEGNASVKVDIEATSQSKAVEFINLRGEFAPGGSYINLLKDANPNILAHIDDKFLQSLSSRVVLHMLTNYERAGDFSSLTAVKEKLIKAYSHDIREVLSRIDITIANDRGRGTPSPTAPARAHSHSDRDDM